MTGHGAKFGRKKEEAIAALLSQRSIEEAARAINVGYKTLLRCLQIPEFRAAYRKSRLDRIQGHDLGAAVIGVFFPFETDAALFERAQAASGLNFPNAVSGPTHGMARKKPSSA